MSIGEHSMGEDMGECYSSHSARGIDKGAYVVAWYFLRLLSIYSTNLNKNSQQDIQIN